MPLSSEPGKAAEHRRWSWIFLALVIWNALLAISFPIQANVLSTREGFDNSSLWFGSVTEMIGLYPHVGYLLAWPSRQISMPGFSHIPWDASGTGGLLISFCSALLAFALYFRQSWAG